MNLPCQSVSGCVPVKVTSVLLPMGNRLDKLRICCWGRHSERVRQGANCPWEGVQYKEQPCGHYATKAICCHTPIIECNLNLIGVNVIAKYLHGF